MNIVFLFYDGMTALDAIGPHEILSRIPGASVKRAALRSGKINIDTGLLMEADYNIADVDHADILVVPGASNATSLKKFPEILDWIKHIHATTMWTTSVCTGSLILGAAGILFGLRATTHWAVLDRLQKYGAEPVKERVVESGKIMTCAGVSAGIDMALKLTARIVSDDLAKMLQLAIEYDPEPPFQAGSPEKLEDSLVEKLREKMLTKFEKE